MWECSKEGLGNLRSLSSRWRESDGSLSSHAHETLDRLGPILVERLAALATASPESSATLLAGLSTGPFEHKWGALPVALWLAAEEAVDPGALAELVAGGPKAVLSLARRHLPPELAASVPTECASCSDDELVAER